MFRFSPAVRDLYRSRKKHSPSEGRFELWHGAQTLHCGVHIAGVAQVGQATRQLHLKHTEKQREMFAILQLGCLGKKHSLFLPFTDNKVSCVFFYLSDIPCNKVDQNHRNLCPSTDQSLVCFLNKDTIELTKKTVFQWHWKKKKNEEQVRY